MRMVATMTTSAHDWAVSLLARTILEPDPVRARQLAQQYAVAFNDAVVDAWGRRLQAGEVLLDQAERLLDEAAVATGRERQRLVRLASLCMDSACARP
jgi:hypothetical protein